MAIPCGFESGDSGSGRRRRRRRGATPAFEPGLFTRLWQRRSGAGGEKGTGFRMEALEQRYLLSADPAPFLIDMADHGNDLSLRYDQLTRSLDVYDRASGSKLTSKLVQEITLVKVKGTSADDTLELNFDAGTVFPVRVHMDGHGGDDDVLISGELARIDVNANTNLRTTIRVTGDDGTRGVVTLRGVEEITDTSASTTKVFRDSSAFGNRLTLSDAGPAEDGAGRITSSTNQLVDYSFSAPNVRLVVDAGRGDDTIEMTGVDQVLTSRVVLHGGEGNDTLTGPPTDAVWTISGTNRGNVDGVAFVNFETLQGAADTDDLFIVTGRGALTGGLDGGAGGFDSMRFEGGRFGTVEYVAFGPHSGTVTRDGVTLSYDGLEPIDDVMVVDHRIINLTGGSDDAVLTQDAATGLMTIAPAGTSTFELINFLSGSISTTINLGGDSGTLLTDGDRLVVRGVVDMGSTNLSILGNDGIDTVEVEAGAALLTTGNVTINAERISIAGSIGSDASAPASITLAAEASDSGNILANTPLEGVLDDELRGLFVAVPRVSVELTGGSLRAAGDITVSAVAGISIPAASPSSLGGALDATLLTLLPEATVTLDGALVRTAGSFSARSEVTVEAAFKAEAEAGTNAATADAAVAVVVVVGDSSVTTAGATRIEAGGSVSLTATSDIGIASTADGGSDASSVGATLAVTTVQMDTRVDVGGATSIGGFGADGADAITLAATLTGNVATSATSTAGGAQDGSATDGSGSQSSERLADPNQDGSDTDQAATSEGGVGFAGAVVVSDYRPETVARISTSGILTTDGTVSVSAGSTDSVSAMADGSTTGTGATGVGVAVAIGVVDTVVAAEIGGGVTINAGGGVTVASAMAAGETFVVSAVSGSGDATQTGVAGSLAIHTVLSDVTATVGAAELSGGDLSVSATSTSATTTSATPGEGAGAQGGTLGVGASVALSILDQDTFAGFADGAPVTGAGAVTLTAASDHDATTTATGASASGGTAATPVVAISINTGATATGTGTGDAVTLGSLAGSATHAGSTVTEAAGSAEGGSTTFGAALALTISDETVTASFARDMTATGDLSMSAAGAMQTRAGAEAGAAGAAEGSGGTDGVDGQTAQQQSYANSQAGARGGQQSTQTGTPSSATGEGGGGLSVAAAIAVNLQDSAVSAQALNGVTLVAGGAVALTARSNADGWADADGSATVAVSATADGSTTGGTGTTIGAAVALNVSKVDVTAQVAGTATVTAASLTLEAGSQTVTSELEVTASKVVDADGDSIFLGPDHGLADGTVVTYAAGSGNDPIGGLTDGTTYVVIELGEGRIQLAEEGGDGSAIDLTGVGTGTGHSLTSTAPDSTPVSFDPDRDLFAFSSDTPLRTGDEVLLTTGDGLGFGAFESGVTYYVVQDGAGYQLAESRAAAFAGESIAIEATTTQTLTLSDSVNRSATDAVSGASGGDTGIAGSVSIDVAEVRAVALLSGNATLAGGDLSITAMASNAADARATAAQSDGAVGSTGVGASFALVVTDHLTRAAVADGAGIAGTAGAVTLSATGRHDSRAETKGGSAGQGTAVTPVAAIVVAGNTTEASLGTGGLLTLTGDLAISATHDAVSVAIGTGDAEGTDAAIGLSLALMLADDAVRAGLARDVSAGGAVLVRADGAASTETVSAASSSGQAPAQPGGDDVNQQNQAQVNNANSQASSRRGSGQGANQTTTPNAQTADGALTVAAAVALDISTFAAVAETRGALAIDAGGALSVEALGNMDGRATATGEAVDASGAQQGGGAVGVGVAVLASTGTIRASVTDATVTAAGLSVKAGIATRGEDETHIFSAGATSGASSAQTGVAGAFALNLSGVTVNAILGGGTSITIIGGAGVDVIADGAMESDAVTASAQERTAVTQQTQPGQQTQQPRQGAGNSRTNTGQSGTTLGVGASVSILATDLDVTAAVAGTATITAAGDVTVSAEASHTALSKAVGGASGGEQPASGTSGQSGPQNARSTSITPVAAIAAVQNSATAEIGPGAAFLAGTGDVVVSAKLLTETTADAEGSVDGTNAAIGASLGLTIAEDAALASMAGTIVTTGAVAVLSQAITAARSVAEAAAKGNKQQSNSTRNQTQAQTANNVSTANNAGGTNGSATRNGQGVTQTSQDAPTVAAAIGLNISTSSSVARIAGEGGTAVVSAGGPVTVGSLSNADGSADASGVAVNATTGVTVGAGVAVNVTDTDNIGLIENAQVTGNGVSATARMAERVLDVGVGETSAVDVDTDTITVAGVTFTAGEEVVYRAGEGGTAIGGLTDGETYVVILGENGAIQLAETGTPDTAIDLTSRGAGDAHVLQRGVADDDGSRPANDPADVTFDPESFALSLQSRQGLVTGDAVVYTADGPAIEGLTGGTTYYANVGTDGVLKLAATFEQALAGDTIALTGVGTGGTHAFTQATHSQAAQAISGASGGDTAVSGSIAISITGGTTRGAFGTGAAINVTGTGASAVAAEADTYHLTTAVPQRAASGASTGIGVSFALTVAGHDATAEIAGDASVIGAADLSVIARGGHTVITLAQAGAVGNASATNIGGAIALAVSENTTTAQVLGGDVALDVAGDLAVTADTVLRMQTEADADTKGGATGIGAAVGLGWADDDATALLDRDVSTGAVTAGEVTVRATGTTQAVTLVTGSAEGEKSKSTGGKTSDKRSKQEKDFVETRTDSSLLAPNPGGTATRANTQSSNQTNNPGGQGGQAQTANRQQSGAQVQVAAALGAAIVNTSATATIATNRTIRADGTVSVVALNDADARTEATGLALVRPGSNTGSGGGSGGSNSTTAVGAAVSVVVGLTRAEATLGGDVTAGAVLVEAGTTEGETNEFRALAIAGSGAKQSGSGSGSQGSTTSVAGAAGIIVGQSVVAAQITDGATVEAVTGDVDVLGRSQVGISNVAAGGSAVQSSGGGSGGSSSTSVGAALTVTVLDAGAADVEEADPADPSGIDNTGLYLVQPGVLASIGAGATVTAAGDVTVDAAYGIAALQLDVPLLGNIDYVGDVLRDAVSRIAVTSLALGASVASGGDAGAGSGIITVILPEVRAVIGGGSVVDAGGDVSVTARDEIGIVNFAGSVAGTAGSEGKGIGVGLDVLVIEKTTEALIGGSGDLAMPTDIRAGGDITVDASSLEDIFQFSANLGVGSSTSGAGSLVVTVLLTDTRAIVGSDADAPTAGGASLSADGSVAVAADSVTLSSIGAGSVGVSFEAETFGASVVVLVDLDRTNAQIGAGSAILARGQGAGLAVRDGMHGTGGVQGSETVTGFALTATSHEDHDIIAIGASGSFADSAVGLSVGVAVVQGQTLATVAAGVDIDTTQTGAQGVLLRAVDRTNVDAETGGGSFTIGGDTAVGGAVAVAIVSNEVHAELLGGNAVTTGTGGLRLEADSASVLRGLAIGVAGTLSTQSSSGGSSSGSGGPSSPGSQNSLSFAGAGSGTGNTVDNSVRATIGAGADIRTTGAVALSAADASRITADAGGFAVAINTGGNRTGAIGAAVAINFVTLDIVAEMGGGHIDAGGDVSATATNAAVIDALTVAGTAAITTGGSSGGGSGGPVSFGGAGSGSGNSISHGVTARFAETAILAGGSVAARATDRSDITSDAGTGNLQFTSGTGNGTSADVTAGAAAATNDIAGAITAEITGGSVDAGGAIDIAASSTATIDTFALSVAGSLDTGSNQGTSIDISLAGAGNGNFVRNAILAQGLDTDLTAGGDITVAATDAAMISALAGEAGLQISTGSSSGTGVGVDLGAAVSVNDIANSAEALLIDTVVDSGGALALRASSDATISATAFAVDLTVETGSESGTNINLNGVVAVTINDIANSAIAEIRDTGGAAETTFAATGVTLTARETGTIGANAVSAAATVDVGSSTGTGIDANVQASIARNTITNTTSAAILGAEVETGGAVTLAANSAKSIDANVVAAGVGVSAGSGGGTSVGVNIAAAVGLNEITNTNSARIADAKVAAKGGGVSLNATESGTISTTLVAAKVGIDATTGGTKANFDLTAAVAKNVIKNTTEAVVEDGSIVTANGNFRAIAQATGGISVNSIAASVSVGAGSGQLAVIGSGAGAVALNTVSREVRSGIHGGSSVTGQGAGEIRATDSGSISANVIAAAVSVTAGSSQVAVSVALAVSFAENVVTSSAQALIDGGSTGIFNGGDLVMVASSTGAISVVSVAASVSVTAGGGNVGFSGAVAGADASNSITNTVSAGVLDGSTADAGGAVRILALDSARVTSTVVSAAVAVTAGSQVAVAVAVGVALAENTITNTVSALVSDSRVEADGAVRIDARSNKTIEAVNVAAAISVAASSGSLALSGAVGVVQLQNVIGGSVEARIVEADAAEGQGVFSGGALRLLADNSSTIKAVGVAVAVSVAAGSAGLSLSLSGAATISRNTISQATRSGIAGSLVTAQGPIDIDTVTASRIEATTVAVSVSVAATSSGVALSGAFGLASAENVLSGLSEAAMDGSTVTATGGSVTVDTLDISTIRSDVIAAAVSIAASVDAAAAAIGVSVTLSQNTMSGQSLARIAESSVTATGAGSDVRLSADSRNAIEAVAVAASFALSGSGTVALAGAGSGADAKNVMTNTVAADVARSTVTAADAVLVTSDDTSSITATIVSAAVGVSVSGTAALTGVVAVTLAENSLSGTHRATIGGSVVTATAGPAEVLATANNSILATSVAVAISVAGSGGFAGAGAGTGINARNVLENTLEASVTGGSLTAGQGVTVSAEDRSDITATMVAVSAAISVSSSAAVSISISVNLSENTIGTAVDALIDGATVTASSVEVSALNDTAILATGVTVGVSFAGSGGLSIGGTGAGTFSSNTIAGGGTRALILNDATVTTPGAVTISASDTSEITADLISVSVSIAVGSTGAFSFAVAGTVAQNTIGGGTTAGIGGASGPDGTTVTAASLDIDATNDATINALGLAVAVSGGGDGAITISAAGAGVLVNNTLTGITEARIRGAELVDVAGAVTVNALDSSEIIADINAFAVTLSISGGAAVSVSIAATIASNTLQGGARAVIDGATVEAGTVTVDAKSTAAITSNSISAAISIAAGTAAALSGAGAGADSTNLLDNFIEASITGGSVVTSAGAVSLRAEDDSSVIAGVDAISAAISAGTGFTVALAVSVSLTKVDHRTQTIAQIDESTVTAQAGNVSLTALSSGLIDIDANAAAVAVTAGAGLALSGSGAGAVANVVSAAETAAKIVAGSDVTASQGSVILDADDETTLDVDALGIAVSIAVDGTLSGVAGSAAVVVTTVDIDFDGSVTALIEDSKVTASGDVTLTADANTVSEANAASVSVSLSVGGIGVAISVGAGIADNSVGVTTTARIADSRVADGQGVRAGGAVTVSAEDSVTMTAEALAASIAVAVGAGGGTVAIAAAISTLTLDGATIAAIDASDVTATSGKVSVDARTTSDLDNISTAASVAISGSIVGIALSGAGASGTTTVTQDVRARIAGGSDVVAGGAVDVLAEDQLTSKVELLSLAVSVGTAGAGAVGIATATNTITTGVRAYVEDSDVEAKGGAITIKALSDHGDGAAAFDDDIQTTVSAVAVAAALVGVAVAGANATTTIDAQVEAYASNADLAASGAVTVDADSIHVAAPRVFGLGVSTGVAVAELVARAEIGGHTRAFIDGESKVRSAGALDVTADSNALAAPDGTSVAVGLGIGAALSGFDAVVTRETAAYVGTRDGEAVTALGTIDLLGKQLNLTATSTLTATADNFSGGFGLLAGAATSRIDALVTGKTLAYVGQGQQVDAAGVAISATSTETATAKSDVVAASIGITAAISNTTARITSRTEAFAGAGADDGDGDAMPDGFTASTVPMGIDVGTGAVTITADSSMTALSQAKGGGFGSVTVSVFKPVAEVTGAVRAYVREGVDIEAGSLSVTAGTEDDRVVQKAEAKAFAVGISFLASVTDLEPEATTNGVVEAFLGAPTNTAGAGNPDSEINISGTSVPLTVQAWSDFDAIADVDGGGGSLLVTVNAFRPTANAGGATRAFAGDGLDLKGPDLKLFADGAATADSDLFALGLSGVADVNILKPVANVTNTVEAYLGHQIDSTITDVAVIRIDGSVDVDAVGRSLARAESENVSVALGVSVTEVSAQASLSGTTRAAVGRMADITADTSGPGP